MGDDLSDLAASTAAGLRPLVEREMAKAYGNGFRDGIATARHTAETVRADLARRDNPLLALAIEVLDGLLCALSDDPLERGCLDL